MQNDSPPLPFSPVPNSHCAGKKYSTPPRSASGETRSSPEAGATANTRGNRPSLALTSRVAGGRSSPSPHPPSHLVTINTSNSRMRPRFLNLEKQTAFRSGIPSPCPEKFPPHVALDFEIVRPKLTRRPSLESPARIEGGREGARWGGWHRLFSPAMPQPPSSPTSQSLAALHVSLFPMLPRGRT